MIYVPVCKLKFITIKFPLLSVFLFLLIMAPSVNAGVPTILKTDLKADQKKPDNKSLCITKFTHGSVNWKTGEVKASGRACPSDRKKTDSSDYILSAAKADASNNIRAILKKIGFTALANRPDYKTFHKIDHEIWISGKKISDYASFHDTIMAGIETIASNAKITEQHYTSDRAMEVTIETSIFGGFLQLVLPDSIREIPEIKFIDTKNNNNNIKNAQIKIHKKQTQFTGLIIDVKGLGFHPVIYPVVSSEQGEKIYSSMFISREYAVQRGVCGYACTMEEAVNSKRTGINPIIIKGLRTGGAHSSSIIISRSDAEKIESTADHYRFMKQCRVTIVLD